MKTIGKYIVCGFLGKGGMSVVYKARLPLVDRIVALKLLAPHPSLEGLLGREAIRDRFIREAQMLASLRCPNVVGILDFDYHRGDPFFTMEYYYRDLGRVIGETYRPDAPSRPLSMERAIRYLRQLLAGLARLARAGIVHRDVKPANLLITDEDNLKLADFGLSKLRGEKFGRPPHLMVGSPFYAAPEQERDPDGVDYRADLYSAGIIAHRMLTGLLPEGGIQKPSLHHPDADPGWDLFVERALQPDPRKRFESADAMLHELENLARAWSERKEYFCRSVPEEPANPERGFQPAGKPRSVPIKTGTAKPAHDLFACDPLMRPLAYSPASPVKSPGGLIAVAPDTGLAWQASGSADPLDWENARAYVFRLNEAAFSGCSNWRLPTVDELLSILRPPLLGIRDCIDPVFDERQKNLWSSDRRSFRSAWYVDVELGFAGFADFTCHFHVRAVTDLAFFPGLK